MGQATQVFTGGGVEFQFQDLVTKKQTSNQQDNWPFRLVNSVL
jgi:hypothetical protein